MSAVKNVEKNFYFFMTFQVQAPCVQTGFWRLDCFFEESCLLPCGYWLA